MQNQKVLQMCKKMADFLNVLEEHIPNEQRLTSPTHAKWLHGLVQKTSNNAWICEIGCLYGYLTGAMALACLKTDRRVVVIDHMIGNYCMPPDKRPPCIYTEFVDNMIKIGVWEKVLPFPMKSHGYAHTLGNKKSIPYFDIEFGYLQAHEMLNAMGIQFEVIYLDGNHSYENVTKELELYGGLLKPGGVIGGDDCQLGGESFFESFTKGKKAIFVPPDTKKIGVAPAVWEFFDGNDAYVPVETPLNQFGFRKK